MNSREEMMMFVSRFVVEEGTDMSLRSQCLSEIRKDGKEMIVIKEIARKVAKKKSSFNFISIGRQLNKVLSLIEPEVRQQDTSWFLLGLQLLQCST
jgi:hypothetical protein